MYSLNFKIDNFMEEKMIACINNFRYIFKDYMYVQKNFTHLTNVHKYWGVFKD
jgi:hypothetical protein